MTAGPPEWSRRPLSVVVLGNSVAFMQMPPRTDSDDGVYAEVLADELWRRRIPTQVHLEARWYELATQGLARYESAVVPHVPDVLVLHYGVNEMQPWLTPMWLMRHLMTRHRATADLPTWYRRVIAPRVWQVVRDARRPLARAAGTHSWQLRPRRMQRALGHVIRVSRNQFRPLVLVLDVNPPGALLRHYLPGIERRHEIVQAALHDLVHQHDDDEVRLVRVSALVEAVGVEAGVPDGIHLAADLHRRLGLLLADEIGSWAEARRNRGPQR